MGPLPLEVTSLWQADKEAFITLLVELTRDKQSGSQALWSESRMALNGCPRTSLFRNETRLLLPHLSRSALWCKRSSLLLPSLCSLPHSLWRACSGPVSLRNCRLMRETSELPEQLNNRIPPFLKPIRMFAKTQTAWGGVRK